MRILFAVSNEKDSDAITKQYQQEYKEEITKKNVYYFNAIQKELQKDKVYDKIVISEDLEAFSNNNYIAIDKFIAEKIRNIVEEAENSISAGAQIIIICNDRREKSCDMLLNFWELGIYNALVGKDRNIKTICSLINKPRTKNEAKVYYQIDTGEGKYNSDNGETVSEEEIQNILIHYKKLGRNEEKYVESFNSIAMQYTDTQLKLIIGFLPLNVKAVLESKCDKYKQLVTSSDIKTGKKSNARVINNVKNTKKEEKPKYQPPSLEKNKAGAQKEVNTKKATGKLVEKQFGKSKITKPVVIPTSLNMSAVKKLENKKEELKDELLEPEIDEIPEDNLFDLDKSENVPNVQKPSIEADLDSLDMFDLATDDDNEAENETVIESDEEENIDESEDDVLPGFEDEDDFEEDEAKEIEETDEKEEIEEEEEPEMVENIVEKPKRGRGRPRKNPEIGQDVTKEQTGPKRGRGRPKKVKVEELPVENIDEEVDLFDLGNGNDGSEEDLNEEESVLPGIDDSEEFDLNEESSTDEDEVLPGFDNEENFEEDVLPGIDEEEDSDNEDETDDEEDSELLPGLDDGSDIISNLDELDDFEELEDSSDSEDSGENVEEQEENTAETIPGFDDEEDILPGIDDNDSISLNEDLNNSVEFENNNDEENNNKIENIDMRSNVDIASLLTRDKKIVSFVGTSKNGTSFIVNNLAQMTSEKGIKTAILDLTKNKNAYYVYTDNQEELRNISFSCIKNLVNGQPTGIEINKDLTVFTSLPGEDEGIENYLYILETLLKNYSLILLDCDFNTNYGYFKESQEIYLVQSYDVLTIQPLTAFLRDLKSKNVLNVENLRIVLNKEIKVRNATAKAIIGGMSIYNDPSMSFMTELFNKDLIKYCSIPFEVQTYSRYLEGLVDCNISLKGYSKSFLMYLSKLANMVYPLLNSGYGKKNTPNYVDNKKQEEDQFSAQMNETLNKMKNKI